MLTNVLKYKIDINARLNCNQLTHYSFSAKAHKKSELAADQPADINELKDRLDGIIDILNVIKDRLTYPPREYM